MKPVLLKHYRLRVEPSRNGAGDQLIFTSERKRFAISGRSLDVFRDRVVPLLDGQHTLDEIKERMADVFAPADIEDSLSLLVRQGIVEDAERTNFPTELEARLGPELSYFREASTDPSLLLARLAAAHVTVVGVGAVGAVAATALAAAGVGRVRCADSAVVSAADPCLAQLFSLDDVGRQRAETIRDKIRAVSPSTSVEVIGDELESVADFEAAIEDSDCVLGCLDQGLARMTRRLNRACLAQDVIWCSATVSAYEGVVGPTVIPHETACFQCYELRAISCSDDPRDAVADLRHRAERNTDESPHRENLAFGAGIVGQLAALEVFKVLLGVRPPTAGRIVTLDLLNCDLRHHVVLRKPWCPACFPSTEA